jgi:hypothetical protein
MTTLQVDIGGLLSPASRGPHSNEMEDFVTLIAEAGKRRDLEEEDDLSKQLLFRTACNMEPENDVRCAAAFGNKPVTVIDACPS